MIRIVDDGGDVVSADDREPFCSCDALCDGDDEDGRQGFLREFSRF